MRAHQGLEKWARVKWGTDTVHTRQSVLTSFGWSTDSSTASEAALISADTNEGLLDTIGSGYEQTGFKRYRPSRPD